MKFPAWPMSGPWTETWKSWNRNSFVRVEMFSQVQNVREPCGLNGLRTKSSCEMYKTCANMCKKSENMYKLSQVMWAHVKNCQDMSSLVDFSGLQWTQWARPGCEHVVRAGSRSDASGHGMMPTPNLGLCIACAPWKYQENTIWTLCTLWPLRANAMTCNDVAKYDAILCNCHKSHRVVQASYNLRTPTDLVTATLTLIRVTSAKLSAFCISTLLKASPLAKAQALPAICL